jgi:hypothetical protein
MGTQPDRQLVRSVVRGAYDIQKLRIQTGNRICANFRAKMGQAPGKSVEDITDKEAQAMVKQVRKSYKLLMDGLKKPPNAKLFAKMDVKNSVISTFTEFCLVQQYVDLEKDEKSHFKRLKAIMEEFPIYNQWMVQQKGVAEASGGILISEFDIYKAPRVSNMWKYAGLDVAEDGAGRSKRKEHLIDVEYTTAAGTLDTKKSITYNEWLKTKLVGVMAANLIRADHPKYAKVYRDYKHRMENHPVYGTARDRPTKTASDEHKQYLKDAKEEGFVFTSKLRRDRMAKRYMMKMFLLDLYLAWRTLEGLPVPKSYHEEKLEHKHAA